jgi:hypothetical protein
MGALHARIPPDLVEQFEKLGEPVVVHRLTRFDDPVFCRAARDWLADRETARQVARHGRELAEDRRERRRIILLAAALIIAWLAILAALLLQPATAPSQEPLEAGPRSQPATIVEVE